MCRLFDWEKRSEIHCIFVVNRSLGADFFFSLLLNDILMAFKVGFLKKILIDPFLKKN